jgi:hypothetical protein
MQTSKPVRDFPLRGLPAAVVLFCGAYFTFGISVCVAAYQRGTAIRHDDPVTFAMLWREAWSVSWRAVAEWFSVIDGCGFFLVSTLSLWFLATLSIAFLLSAYPRLFLRSPRAFVFAGLVIGLGTLFGLLGIRNLEYTFLNAFAWRGLDGEWVIELGPVLDAVGILWPVACLLLARVWFFRIRTDDSAPV